MINTHIFITVRSNSGRLPEKALRLISPGVSLVEYCISRALQFADSSKIIVATTDDPSDDFLAYVALQSGVNVYRGSVQDKLSRWAEAAKLYNSDHILCFDGDDPFTDLDIGYTCSNILRSSSASIIKARNVPCGSFTYAINANSLFSLLERFDTSNSEMMWTYFEDDPLSSITTYCHEYSHSHNLSTDEIESIRITVDYDEDIALIRRIIQTYSTAEKSFTADHMVSLYLENPQLFSCNSFRQSQYLANQTRIISTLQN